MRILITGVTGFVGAPLAARLTAAGHTLVGLSRNAMSARQKVPALDHAHDWDGARGEVPDEALEGVDAVVHLAGEPVAGRWTNEKKRKIESSRVEGTRRVVDAIERAEPRPRVLVCASAIGYYGDRGEDVLPESTEPADDFLAEVCKGWEAEAQRAEGLGLRVVRLRIGLVMGDGGGALHAMLPLFKAGLGGRLGDGQQWWPWIHVDDVVGLIGHALDTEAVEGAYNAVSPEPVRQEEFAKTLAKVLHRPAVLPAPAFAIKTVLGSFAAELLASRRVVPERTLETGYAYRYTSLERALTDATST